MPRSAAARADSPAEDFPQDAAALALQIADYEGQIAAIKKVQAVIEFGLDGVILDANQNFLDALGYTLAEIKGQHHRLFVQPDERESAEYKAFWEKLGRGEFDAGQYRRIAKGGREVWIQASYNPIFDPDGKPFKVVKYATDITGLKLQTANYEGQIAAIKKAQAVIEFNLDGTIIDANSNFLDALGYSIEEVRGQHHSLFVEPDQRQSAEYRLFWEKLGRGEYDAGQYKRIAKGGREIWIQASYNPIMDMNGRPFKVVKYATDITQQKLQIVDFEGQIGAIKKAQAVIEFSMDGKILNANQNFLDAIGYSIEEIRGQHHSMFVEPDHRQSFEYRAFWEKLGRGEYDAGQYKRIAKGGREIWIQASYNPILDMSGRPFKVVKYATDITAQQLQNADFEGQIGAIKKAQAVIEFSMDGKILNANQNFLDAIGYSIEEIRGQHHSMFVHAEERQSFEYRSFWEKLGRGEYDAGQYKRIAKGGREIWIQASYNPILDMNGRPFKVVKYATDVTQQKLQTADYEGQIAAIKKSQAVIEFNLDGTIIEANQNFLDALGYTLAEIKGQHHSLFVTPEQRQSFEYRAFWEKLGRGEYDAGQYKRIGKGGREIWIQASYNPILDMNGKPFKVVKYASDVTSQRRVAERVKEISGIVASAATQMQATAETMAQAADDATRRSGQVALAAEAASMNVQTVASAGEELSASINEIARQVTQSTIISQQAVAETDKTGASIQTLAEAAKKIGNVVTLINNIAGQTKLLALNATIEAARAGDAGKGFAVVASEVKSLSDQTAKATHEISSQVSAMQAATDTSVSAIQGIADTIRKVAEIASAIASAVEEQSAATREISANVAQAAEGTQQVSSSISGVSEAAAQTNEASADLLGSSGQLAKQAEALSGEMDLLLVA